MDNEGELSKNAQKIRSDIIDLFKITNEKVVVCVAFINYPLVKTVSLYKDGEYYGAFDWLGRALPKKCEFDSFLFGADFSVIKEELTKHQWQIEFTIL